MSTPTGRYAVPALERGLDIIEMLAQAEHGLTLSDIARALDLSASSIFRTLVVLEHRGYIAREAPDDTYVLSLRLFELSQVRPPIRRLMDTAMPAMRLLAQQIGQPVHLSVHDNGQLLVLADVDGPGPVNLSFRPGGRWPMRETVSGRVLLAHQRPLVRAAWLSLLPPLNAEQNRAFIAALERIAGEGCERAASDVFTGIVDIGVPVLAPHGAVAAVTVSMMTMLKGGASEADVLVALRQTARDIAARLGGTNEQT